MEHSHKDIDVTVLIPIYKEGEDIRIFLDELISELKKLNRSWEIIIEDSRGEGSSEVVLKEYSDKYPNFTTVMMTHPGVAVTDKNKKYVLGFQIARGKYIISMDGDGQDVPAEMYKFIEKLDEGYDFVIGHKQNRKDGFFYNLTSKIANTLNRKLTGVQIHDMNNGYKAFRADVARELKLRGGMFRFIPALLVAKNKKITEVPVKHRERMFAQPKFNFKSRLQGGLFDLLTVVAIIGMQETPMYFFGWLAIALKAFGITALIVSLYVSPIEWKVYWLIVMGVMFVGAFVALMSGLVLAYLVYRTPHTDDDFGVLEVYPEHPSMDKH